MAYMANLPAIIKADSNGRRRSSRCHFRNGMCCAAVRAIAAAESYLQQEFMTLEGAAIRHGSSVAYVRAAVILLKSENQQLIDQVLRGELLILEAAKLMVQFVKLVAAHRAATPANLNDFFTATGCTADLAKHLVGSLPEERTRAARVLGAELTWDQMVAPLVR
jgi:hypothetical protein